MTDLRDARLKQALDHAPDAHMAPDARTRAAIKAMAGQAAEPAPPVPWWRRLAGTSSPSTSSRMPWNAAFATVLLASLVTLIWRDEEIPGAKTGDPPMASAPPTPAASEAAAQAAPALPAPIPSPIPARPAESRPAPESKADALAKKAEGGRADAQAKSATAAAESAQRERRSPALVDAPAVVQSVPPPDPRPAMEVAPRAAPVPPPPMARVAPVAPPVQAPAPAAPAAALPSRQRESQPMANAARAAGAPGGPAIANEARSGFAPLDDAALQGWTQARITFQGRTQLVSRAQAESLAVQVRALALAVAGRKGVMGPVVLQVELLEGGLVTGTLAVGETTARWTQSRGGIEQESIGSVDAALVRQLLEEAGRLMAR